MASRLITEQDVIAGRVDDPIVVDRDTVITPAALDRARLLSMRILFDRDGEAGGRPADGPRSATPLGAASWPDGHYLVTVHRGEVRVHRLGADGPHELHPSFRPGDGGA